MYDAYISLGSNCEAGLNFRRIGYEVSSFFRFTNSSYGATMRLIKQDFEGVYLKDNIQPVRDRMIKDLGTGVVHHSKLLSCEQNGVRQFNQDYDFDEVYAQEYSKVCYLIQKWRNLTNSDQKVLYIFKHHHSTSRALAKEMLTLLRCRYPNHASDLLYIQLEAHREPAWSTDGLFNRYFTRFAPTSNAHDYDIAAWDQLFADFPLKASAPRGKQKQQTASGLLP